MPLNSGLVIVFGTISDQKHVNLGIKAKIEFLYELALI